MPILEERMQILRMIEQGKISAAEGAQLLRSLNQSHGDVAAAVPPTADSRSRWLHVSITDLDTGKKKVDINIPIGLVNVGLKMGARFAPDMNDDEYQNLVSHIQQATKTGQPGKIMSMHSKTGDYVEVYVE